MAGDCLRKHGYFRWRGFGTIRGIDLAPARGVTTFPGWFIGKQLVNDIDLLAALIELCNFEVTGSGSCPQLS